VLRPGSTRIYYGWVIVAVALMINVASSPLNAGIFSFFVTPMSEDLGWSKATLSWAMTCRLLVAGCSGPVLGVLLDRHGTRVLGGIAGLIAGLTTIGLAFMDSVWQFYLLSALSGLSGFGAPAGQLLTIVPVAKWFQANRGRALAIATVGLPLGTTVYILAAQRLIEAFGWREAWAISGASVLLISVPLCLVFMRKDPESIGLALEGTEGLNLEGDVEAPATEVDWTPREVLRSRVLWAIVAALALSGIVLPGTVVYRVAFWEDLGLASSTVAFATALDPLTVTFSALFFGFASARMPPRQMGLIGGLIVALSMAAMVAGSGSVALLVLYNLTWGIGMGANITVNNVIWPEYFGRRFLGTIRGVVFPVSVATSAVSVPFFAVLLDLSPSPSYVWGFTLVAFVIAGLLLFCARKPELVRAARDASVPAAVEAG
jgi:MFS family permease